MRATNGIPSGVHCFLPVGTVISVQTLKGASGVVAAEKAYELLFQTVYRPGIPYLFCCAKPVFCPTTLPGDKGVARPDYNTTVLRQALELMVEAAPQCDTNAFKYDLVDVAREWLSMTPCLTRFDAVNSDAPPAAVKTQTSALLDVMADVDAMMVRGGKGGGSILDVVLHSRMPLVPTPTRLKLLHACDHSSQEPRLQGWPCNLCHNTEGPAPAVGSGI